MKSRETLVRLKKFQVDEKRRKVAQIETMIAEFDRVTGDLEREIRIEQDRAGIHDPAHFAYPTYAKAAIARRENLKRSIDELRIQLEDAKSALGEAFDDLKKLELLDVRDQMSERRCSHSRTSLPTASWAERIGTPCPIKNSIKVVASRKPSSMRWAVTSRPAFCGLARQLRAPADHRAAQPTPLSLSTKPPFRSDNIRWGSSTQPCRGGLIGGELRPNCRVGRSC